VQVLIFDIFRKNKKLQTHTECIFIINTSSTKKGGLYTELYTELTKTREVFLRQCVITNTRILKQNKHFHTNIHSHIFHTPNVFLSRILLSLLKKSYLVLPEQNDLFEII